MDKKTAMENLARKAHEKGVFNGTWLYAENGQIISKGAFGFRDAEDKLPMQEDSIFEMARSPSSLRQQRSCSLSEQASSALTTSIRSSFLNIRIRA